MRPFSLMARLVPERPLQCSVSIGTTIPMRVRTLLVVYTLRAISIASWKISSIWALSRAQLSRSLAISSRSITKHFKKVEVMLNKTISLSIALSFRSTTRNYSICFRIAMVNGRCKFAKTNTLASSSKVKVSTL